MRDTWVELCDEKASLALVLVAGDIARNGKALVDDYLDERMGRYGAHRRWRGGELIHAPVHLAVAPRVDS